MTTPIGQHAIEIQRTAEAWRRGPLLRRRYDGFYDRLLALGDPAVPGALVEIGSGIGNLKARVPRAVATDLFPQPWLDVVCDARRVLALQGRVIVFDPYISLASFPVYAWLHHEPVAWRAPIDPRETPIPDAEYYAAQGNATRVFFAHDKTAWLAEWRCLHTSASSEFRCLLSGGFSRAAGTRIGISTRCGGGTPSCRDGRGYSRRGVWWH